MPTSSISEVLFPSVDDFIVCYFGIANRLDNGIARATAYGNDRLRYNDHFLREQVDYLRPGINLLAGGINHVRCKEDCFRHDNSLLGFKLYRFGGGLNLL